MKEDNCLSVASFYPLDAALSQNKERKIMNDPSNHLKLAIFNGKDFLVTFVS
jgi:hypothetical protein